MSAALPESEAHAPPGPARWQALASLGSARSLRARCRRRVSHAVPAARPAGDGVIASAAGRRVGSAAIPASPDRLIQRHRTVPCGERVPATRTIGAAPVRPRRRASPDRPGPDHCAVARRAGNTPRGRCAASARVRQASAAPQSLARASRGRIGPPSLSARLGAGGTVAQTRTASRSRRARVETPPPLHRQPRVRPDALPPRASPPRLRRHDLDPCADPCPDRRHDVVLTAPAAAARRPRS